VGGPTNLPRPTSGGSGVMTYFSFLINLFSHVAGMSTTIFNNCC
jgi:hypothetical protein